MCKPRAVENCVKCTFQQGVLNINVNDVNNVEVDDDNDIGLVDDPNVDFNDEMEISMSESNSDVLEEHPIIDDNHMELDVAVPVPNNIEYIFEYEPFPQTNYDLLDCEIILESIVEYIEAVLDNN